MTRRISILADGVSHVRDIPDSMSDEDAQQDFWAERAARRGRPLMVPPAARARAAQSAPAAKKPAEAPGAAGQEPGFEPEGDDDEPGDDAAGISSAEDYSTGPGECRHCGKTFKQRQLHEPRCAERPSAA